MRKILLNIFVVFSVLVLAGCFGNSSRVASLTFTGNDSTAIPPQYYSETKMEILPNYKERILSVRYTTVHPRKLEVPAEELVADPGEDDINAIGSVGGEYFDRFEEVTEFVKEYEAPEDLKEGTISVGSATFGVKVESLRGKVYEISNYWEARENNPEFREMTTLYLDLAKLLTEEEQV